MSWNVATNADYQIDTDGLNDKLQALTNITNVDLESLKSKLDATGYANLTTLADGSSISFPAKVQRTKEKIMKLQEALEKLVNKAQYHIENITAFESGQPVTIEEVSSSGSTTQTSETITIKKGDTLWNLAISMGYEGSEWSKIFKTKDGQPITSQYASNLEIGDEILYVGNQQVSSNISYTTIEPSTLTSVAALEAIAISDYGNLPKDVPSEVFGTTYGGYSSVESPFVNATNNMKITRGMGYYSPWGYKETHYGLDWNSSKGDRGTPITSISDGIVVEVKSSSSGLGNSVTVLSEHVNEETGKTEYMLTTYGHMQSKSKLEEGQVIKVGQEIGKVGSSGNSTGSHLHLETEMHLQPGERKNGNNQTYYISDSEGNLLSESFSVEDIETYEKNGKTYITDDSLNKLYGDNALFDRQMENRTYYENNSELNGYYGAEDDFMSVYVPNNDISLYTDNF